MSKLTKALTAAAGNAGGANLYVEDVFSTYLYDGTDSTQTIVNGIDLSGEGGLVWCKMRDNTLAYSHNIFDTERGIGKFLESNTTDAEGTASSGYSLTSFNSDGFTLGSNWNNENRTPSTNVSWAFRKAEKFFDVVTYTGNGLTTVSVNHSLGVTPGMIIVKRVSNSADWYVWHKDLGTWEGGLNALLLNSTDAEFSGGFSSVSDTNFVMRDGFDVNASGDTYVAYLFASDAGGFGDDGSENIIKCGSFTADGSGNATVNLGFEPQWLLMKSPDDSGDAWRIIDNMRGWSDSSSVQLNPNESTQETAIGSSSNPFYLTSTGFVSKGAINHTNSYIYIAIRRPMKTPESGTEVFAVGTNQEVPSATSGFYSGFPVDMAIKRIITASQPNYLFDRLRGGQALVTNTTAAETGFGAAEFDHQNGWYYDSDSANTNDYSWMFKRATGFFDVVAYTGDGTPSNTVRRDLKHNLGVAPELAILKRRNSTSEWQVGVNGTSLYLNLTNGSAGTYTPASYFNATDFDVEGWVTEANNNVSGSTYIAYLFATLDGVSKVGSYTGTGSNVDVDCGFSAGARFILIKRTDSASNWYLWDSARGITAGNDPYIQLNNTNAQNSGQDAIDPLASGFTVTAAADVNQPSGTYIFLAIA